MSTFDNSSFARKTFAGGFEPEVNRLQREIEHFS
jgi:ATP-dependent Lon protease